MQSSRSPHPFPFTVVRCFALERGEERRERKKREKEDDMWVHL
jgi:hypothetical protein